MNEKNACKIKDEALQNVTGGSDDTKYVVGETVAFWVEGRAIGSGFDVSVEKTGIITAVNGNVYTIKSGKRTYEVKEKDIIKDAIIQVDGGVTGGW